MEAIKFKGEWRYLISTNNTPYYIPEVKDQDWDLVKLSEGLPELYQDETLWLRYHFEMEPNDECTEWWLELGGPLPDETRIWVNYEEIDPVSDHFPPRWDVTYAIAMGNNVVTLRIEEPITGIWRNIACVPYPCE